MIDARIPVLHRAIAEAAVKAILGDRAVVKDMVEVSSTRVALTTHISAIGYGIQAFWNHWTGRHSHGSAGRDET